MAKIDVSVIDSMQIEIQSLDVKISTMQSTINDSIGHNISLVERHVNDLNNLISTTNDCISNEIAASDRLFNIWGIAVTIMTIGLGLYFSWCLKRIKRMSQVISDKDKEIKELKEAVDNTNNQINKDLSSLYLKLRREETITYIKRLNEVPQDINNLMESLLCRDLETEDYDQLLNAFLKLDETDVSAKKYFYQLLYQHFAGMALTNEILKGPIFDMMVQLMNGSFKNDILKSTDDFVSSIKDLSPEIKKQYIIPYYKALLVSKYKERYDLVEKLKSILTDEQWKDILNQTKKGEEI